MVKKNKNTKNNNKIIKKNTVSQNKVVNKKKVQKTKKEVVSDNLLIDKSYKEAEKLYKEKKYDEASIIYNSLLEKYNKHKKLYKRLIECLTHDYSYKDYKKEFKTLFNDYVTTYKLLATKKELKFFEHKLEEYKTIKISTSKSKFLLISLLGFLGVHKFIEKKYILGILYLLTFGFFGIGVIVDLINDYAEYENDFQLDLIRYLIAILILIFAIFRIDTENYYYFIIVAILFTPIVYSKILSVIPGIIKFVAMIVLVCFGFKTNPIIHYIPTGAIGVWETKNENTNLKEIDIKLEKSTVKFNDREEEIGLNEYDIQNNILKVEVDENTYYKFRLELNENKICVYTESQKCIISFEKKK